MRIVKLFGVEDIDAIFRKDRLDRSFVRGPSIFRGNVARDRGDDILGVFPTVIQIANEHGYFSFSPKAPREEAPTPNRTQRLLVHVTPRDASRRWYDEASLRPCLPCILCGAIVNLQAAPSLKPPASNSSLRTAAGQVYD